MVLVQCSGRKKLIVTALLAELLKSCNVMKLCTCMVYVMGLAEHFKYTAVMS